MCQFYFPLMKPAHGWTGVGLGVPVPGTLASRVSPLCVDPALKGPSWFGQQIHIPASWTRSKGMSLPLKHTFWKLHIFTHSARARLILTNGSPGMGVGGTISILCCTCHCWYCCNSEFLTGLKHSKKTFWVERSKGYS